MSKPVKPLPVEADAAAKPKANPKRLVLLAVPLLLAGAGAGMWFTGILPRMLGLSHPAAAAAQANTPLPPIFVEMPEMVANLNATGRKPSYVKLVVRLQVPTEADAEQAKAAMPKLQDLMQTYLRDMRPEELRGSAGTYRLREELVARAAIATAPGQISDVLFTELLVQ